MTRDASSAAPRTASIERETGETRIALFLDLDGGGSSRIETGVGFLDHMLDLFARHGGFTLTVEAVGDLHVDAHHTVEDVGICLGRAIRAAIGDKRGLHRYGHFTLPMDETLATVAVDLSGRAVFAYRVEFPSEKIGQFDTELVEEFWRAVAGAGLCNLHLLVHYGRNSHHIAEAIFKAAARAIRMAVARTGDPEEVPSTKGTLSE